MTDSVDLTPTWVIGSVNLTEYPFSVDRDNTVDIGEPEMVVESTSSRLADGDLERVVRYGNRVYKLDIYIEGATLGELAAAEALLRTELKRTGVELVHDPGDYFSPASVYEVRTASMTPSRRDSFESHLIRRFTLTMTCSPFARSRELSTVEALAGGTTTTTVDTCDAATGWTATRSGAPDTASTAWQAGAVGVAELDSMVSSPETWTLTRTGTVDFSATPYLVVELSTIGAGSIMNVEAYAGTTVAGTRLPAIDIRMKTSTYVVTYDASSIGGSVAALTFAFTSEAGHSWQGMFINNVARSDVLPGVTTRQLSRIIEVGGTERTPGSLRVTAPNGTSPLNLTLVATWPERGSGFSPPLRRWRISGNTVTADAATFSGSREVAGPSFIQHDIPITSLPPGTYQLMAMMRATTAGPYTMEASIQSRMGGVTLGEVPWSEVVNFPVANDWKLVPMGVYSVPIVAAKAGEFRIIYRAPSTTVVQVDEGWLFPVDEDCGLTASLIAEPHLWLDSPDIESQVPRVWEGTASDKSNAHFPRYGIHTMGNHIFSPRTAVFTATFGVDNPKADLTYHKRWHSNAAED